MQENIGTLEKKNSHERDSRIRFDEEPHLYYVDGKEVSISVTSFVHHFFEGFDAQKTIEKFYDRWQANENSPYFGLSPQEIIDLWDEKRDQAASLGTAMHKAIEDFYNGLDVKFDTKELGLFERYEKEIGSKLKPYRTEWEVFAEKLDLAGSIDMIYEDEKGNLHLVDWKRSKEIKENNSFQQGKYPLSHLPDCNFWHYSLQLNCYKAILEKFYGKNVESMALVVLHPNQDEYIHLEVSDLQKEVEMMFVERLIALGKLN